MKKLFAVLLSIVLVFSMGTTALAAQITISNAEKGETYDVYKMLDFTAVAGSTDKGYYTVEAAWENFFAAKPASDYFSVETNADGKRVVSMKADLDDAAKADLAKEAVAYAKAKGVTATTQKADSADVVFDGLTPGYYAIDTSLGTVCALVNADSTFTAVEKNAKPDIDKLVQEDSEINNTDKGWGKVNDADIGDTVNYKSEVTVGAGASDYVMHDTMDAGLTFVPGSVKVEGAGEGDYEVVTDCDLDGCNCTFAIVFDNDFIATKKQGDKIVVTYSAILNENAKVEYNKGTDDYEGNKNTVYLEYNNGTVVTTTPHETVTYTWKLDVFKYTKEGENNAPLAGAEFSLLYGGVAIKLVPVGKTAVEVDGETVEVPTYRVAKDDEVDTKTVIETDTTGKFIIIGLDADVYTLTEVKAPEGYNRANDMEVTIGHDLVDKDFKATYTINGVDPAQIEVENKTGGLFPETGGIGTTIFYVVGILLMLAAVVVLVSKKRMATFA